MSRVLIVGAGVAGLTLAGVLTKAGRTVRVIEKNPVWERSGYVIGLLPIGARVLAELGRAAEFARISQPLSYYKLADDQGNLRGTYQIGHIYRTLARGRLLELLREGVEVELDLSPVAVGTDARGVEVTLSDGSTDRYALLVGADGIHSAVRRLVFGEIPRNYSGIAGWAFWVPHELAEPETVLEYYGDGRYFGVYPAPGEVCCFLTSHEPEGWSDSLQTRHAELRQRFTGMGGLVETLLGRLPAPESIWHGAFHDLKLPRWTQGPVALVGDACHGFMPTAGVGASMALESALVLAQELLKENHLEEALSGYVRRRRKRVDRVQWQARRLMGITPGDDMMRFWEGLLDGLAAEPI